MCTKPTLPDASPSFKDEERIRLYLGTYTDYVVEDLNSTDVYVFRIYDWSRDHYHFYKNEEWVSPLSLPVDVYTYFKGLLYSLHGINVDIRGIKPMTERPFRGNRARLG